MDIYILDPNYEKIGVITAADSVLWNKHYCGVGECEISVPCNTQALNLLKQGNYIYRYDDDMFCKIKGNSIKTDRENGDQLIVTARDMCELLSGRIVRWQTVYTGTVAGYIRKLLRDNVIAPQQTQRKVANFTIDESTFSPRLAKIEVSTHTTDLLQAITEACKGANYGFRVSYNIDTGKLVFRLTEGKNKASATGDDYVEFSPSFANIISTQYNSNATLYKNLVYVGYKDAAGELKLLSMHNEKAEPTGEHRQEIYIDGTNVSRDITREELAAMFADLKEVCVTIDEKKYKNYYTTPDGEDILIAVGTIASEDATEKITVTDYTYIMLIRNVGKTALDEHKVSESFSGEVDTTKSYIYKVDYDLGDIVNVADAYGNASPARVVAVRESEDADSGAVVEPEFEFISEGV